jgi:hypothetical protein
MIESAYVPGWIVQAFVSVYTAVGLAATTASLYIWRRYKETTEVSEEDLLDETRSDVRTRLIDVLDDMTADGSIRTDGGVDRDLLETLIDEEALSSDKIVELGNVGTPHVETLDLHRSRVERYRQSYQCFALLALNAFGLAVVVLISGVTGFEPFTWAWDIAHGIMGITAAVMLFRGMIYFNDANAIDRRL